MRMDGVKAELAYLLVIERRECIQIGVEDSRTDAFLLIESLDLRRFTRALSIPSSNLCASEF